MVLLILVNLIAVTLESVPAINVDHGALFRAIEIAFATRRTSLLVLAAADLYTLMERQPRIAERLRSTVRDRTGEDKLV